MVKEMKAIAELSGDLSTEERNLLSVAYKNVIGARRASWRVLSSLEKNQLEAAKTNQEGATGKAAIIKAYREEMKGFTALFYLFFMITTTRLTRKYSKYVSEPLTT